MFTAEALRTSHFVGFIPLLTLDHRTVPDEDGVYVVLRRSTQRPTFLEASVAGWHKGKDPTVSVATLEERWVSDCAVVYIGKGQPLQRRLKEYRDSGRGKKVGHWGGRYIWQLPDYADLLVCWKATAPEDPFDVEDDLVRDFVGRYGCQPFANLGTPRKRRRPRLQEGT